MHTIRCYKHIFTKKAFAVKSFVQLFDLAFISFNVCQIIQISSLNTYSILSQFQSFFIATYCIAKYFYTYLLVVLHHKRFMRRFISISRIIVLDFLDRVQSYFWRNWKRYLLPEEVALCHKKGIWCLKYTIYMYTIIRLISWWSFVMSTVQGFQFLLNRCGRFKNGCLWRTWMNYMKTWGKGCRQEY